MKKICYPLKEKIITSPCSEKWEVLERFGEQANYGEIWAACCEKDCDYVLKYLAYENDNTKEAILNEMEIQNECASLGLCPKIEDAWFCEEGGAIVMELFHETVLNLLFHFQSSSVKQIILANILVILEKLHIYGIYHGDLHLNNIMVKGDKIDDDFKNEEDEFNAQNYKFYFIDFGKGGKFQRMDDEHIYKDYFEIFSHLDDIAHENPDDEGLMEIFKTMKTHMKRFD